MEETIRDIRDLLEKWSKANPTLWLDAEAVHRQMPTSLNQVEGKASFEEVVWMAAQELFWENSRRNKVD